MQNRNISISEDELNELLSFIKETYGYDFTNYSKASLIRRFIRCMEEAKLRTAYDLKFYLTNNKTQFDWFLQSVTVNVTEMFRDPSFYKAIRGKVLDRLATYPIIKIWHAGCATGEEVFSMAIMLHEAGLLERTKIYATDINPANLEKAKKGIVPLQPMKEYTTNYLQSGGKEEFSNYYTARYNGALISAELRKNIIFAQHNLVTDTGFNEFQMICCRNVMIYFEKDLQDRVIKLFYDSLSPLGYLALGLKESLLFTDIKSKFEVVDAKNKIFRKKK
jgi:chemotaxis protein methyltransferase CheR